MALTDVAPHPRLLRFPLAPPSRLTFLQYTCRSTLISRKLRAGKQHRVDTIAEGKEKALHFSGTRLHWVSALQARSSRISSRRWGLVLLAGRLWALHAARTRRRSASSIFICARLWAPSIRSSSATRFDMRRPNIARPQSGHREFSMVEISHQIASFFEHVHSAGSCSPSCKSGTDVNRSILLFTRFVRSDPYDNPSRTGFALVSAHSASPRLCSLEASGAQSNPTCEIVRAGDIGHIRRHISGCRSTLTYGALHHRASEIVQAGVIVGAEPRNVR